MDETGLEDITLSEMNKNKLGWYNAFTSDGVSRGYAGELRDFLTAMREDRAADLDFEFAYLVMKVIYGAYYAAESGTKFEF